MARSILLALDGSPASDAAIDYGIRLARRNPEVRLTGLGILDEGEIRGPEAVPLGGEAFKEQRDKALLDEAHAKVQSFLAAFQSRCAQAGMNPKIIEARGVPYEEIELEARHHDLVLIERETHFHFETRETESDVFPSLARGSVRPMVAVSTEAPAESGVILVAYDDSRPAARALQMFQLLGLWKDRTVRILTANADPEEAEARCHRAVEFLESHSIAAEAMPIHTEAEAAEVIAQKASELHPELVVMGAYGHGGLRSFIYGSTTKELIEKGTASAVPLFIYH